MAARYFVAAGNWNSTATWSATSGGAPGASFPVAGDDAIMDANSPTGTLVVNVASACATLAVQKSGGSIRCDASLTVSGAVTHQFGTLNTNGQNMSWGSYIGNFTGTRTLTMGASAITITGPGGSAWTTSTTTNLTITANTAVITFTGAGVTFSGSISYNGASLVFTGSGTNTCASGTIANLTVTGTAAKTDVFQMTAGFTITGTLRLGGGSTQGVNRLLVRSNIPGVQRALTVGAVVITGDVDFQDVSISYSGATSWTNSGSAFVGDALGNGGAVTTNLTPSSTQTATGTASFTWSTHGWTGRVPLPQDDVVINNAFVAGRTITVDMPRIGRNITCTCTGSPIFSLSNVVNVYGNLTLATGMTNPSGNSFDMRGRGSHTMTFNGVAITSISVNAPGGTYTIQDNLIQVNATRTFVLNYGTFDANNKNVTLGLYSSGTTTTGIVMGSGTWTILGTGVVWNMGSATTVTPGTSVIDIADTSATAKTFTGGGKAYATLRHIATGSAALTITGNNTFTDLNLQCTTARTITLPASGTQTITGALTLKGSSGQLLSVVSSTPGVQATLSKASGTVDGRYLSLKDSNASGGASFYSGGGSESVFVSNNTGWIWEKFLDPHGIQYFASLTPHAAQATLTSHTASPALTSHTADSEVDAHETMVEL